MSLLEEGRHARIVAGHSPRNRPTQDVVDSAIEFIRDARTLQALTVYGDFFGQHGIMDGIVKSEFDLRRQALSSTDEQPVSELFRRAPPPRRPPSTKALDRQKLRVPIGKDAPIN